MGTVSRFARPIQAAFLVVLMSLVALPASAEYPERPVRVLLGLAAGGGADIVARYYVDKLRELSGGTFFLENKVGASGNIASDALAKSKPDGYTILMAASASQGGNRFLYKNLPFDSDRDIDPITTFYQLGFVLLINPEKTQVNSVAELTALLKAKNGKATYGWAVTSSIASAVLYVTAAEIPAIQVGYKTTGAAVSDLIAGQVDFVFADIVFATGLAKQGRVKILASSADRRASSAPDIPTMAEVGLPQATQFPWWAAWGPHGMPGDIVGKLANWINQITAMPATKEFLTSQGADPLPGSPEQTRIKLQQAVATWQRVVTLAKIEPQ
ncbi:MAG: Bug family tripartite tricarboxylate transporter substrate binding protein [Xanthobacteraceae bacterium]